MSYDESNFLYTTNGSSLINTTNEEEAFKWFFYNTSNSGTQGYLYTVYSGNVKYLNSSSNKGLTLNNTPTTWLIDDNGITIDSANYIQCLNGNWYLTDGNLIYSNRNTMMLADFQYQNWSFLHLFKPTP